MSVETLTATHLAPPKSVPFYEYAKTGVRNFAVTLTRENPLLWSLTTGRHVQADMEGEYLYNLFGAVNILIKCTTPNQAPII